MLIDGKWFQKGSAAHLSAALLVEDERFQLKTADGVPKLGRLDEVTVSDRLGNVERKLTFDDGSVFVTSENDAIDHAFKGSLKANRLLHAIESNLPFVMMALVLTIAVTFSFFKWGVPAVSSVVANALPQKTNELIGSHTLDFLDKLVFEDSKLSQDRQTQIRTHFEKTLVPIEQTDKPLDFVLHFRDWNDGEHGIPNALALPSGDIILTDKFVQLTQNQDEIDAVLLHEMGHVAHRHSLKLVVQSTLVTTIVMVATGDVNGVADLGLGVGSLLLSSNYSRHFESEADQYAFDHMLKLGIDPISFANIMRRMTSYTKMIADVEKRQERSESQVAKPDSEEKTSFLDYFSTHPATEERAKQAEHYSQCFDDGKKVCVPVP